MTAKTDKGRAASRAYYAKNRERAAAYYLENKEKVLALAVKRYAENSEVIKARTSAHYNANKGKVARVNATYREKNRDAVLACKRDYYRRNKARLLPMLSAYKKLKPWVANSSKAKRRAMQLQATPAWTDLNAIKDVYLEAAYMQMHVDHIIPLQSKMVCGLHVWDNLQLLTPSENSSKHNKFDPNGIP